MTAPQSPSVCRRFALLLTLLTLLGMVGDIFAQRREDATDPITVLGGRADKNTVGHGRNVALYTGRSSRFFFATHELGNVFSAVDGETVEWFPDHVTVAPADQTPVHERRDVCVTEDDVVVSRIVVINDTPAVVRHRIVVKGDCRGSFDWRGRPGGVKASRADTAGTILLTDRNVFPAALPDGLSMAISADREAYGVDVATPGAYRLTYDLPVAANGQATLTVACAIDRDALAARKKLDATLARPDPIADNRAAWRRFFSDNVPSFTCSDRGLTELYALRWFLLKFSTAGGDLGLFKYPVVLEGRQAYQTYCCYSAPFMAFDQNWHTDPAVGFGHIANMAVVAHADGRFPWYASPRTNDVKLDHTSKTGMSLLPWTLWRWYQIHGNKTRLAELYEAMARNVRWWQADRDPDGNGLFSIDHQLETGMDDLHRRWTAGKPKRYEAIDATVYAYLNTRAVANMARELGKGDAARAFDAAADKIRHALETMCWDAKEQRYRDRNRDTGEMSDYDSICTFYPLLTDVVTKDNLGLIRGRLLNPEAFWTAHPIPALSQADKEFDPVHGYWRGPSWPAANTHVIEGFATTAKRLDRSLLPDAAELFRRCAANHLQPRGDFYERYDPFDGRGLSDFRDYMHSWWIDLYVRHVAGLMIEDDGTLTIDPLPMKLPSFALRNVPVRGRRVDVLFNDGDAKGLDVRCDGKSVARAADFSPGGPPLKVRLPAS